MSQDDPRKLYLHYLRGAAGIAEQSTSKTAPQLVAAALGHEKDSGDWLTVEELASQVQEILDDAGFSAAAPVAAAPNKRPAPAPKAVRSKWLDR